jgi:hypothetical protein
LNETDRGIFAASSLWGKFGGLYACGATFPHTVPPPNIFVTHLFSKQILKRKDFQEIVRLTWAHPRRGLFSTITTESSKPENGKAPIKFALKSVARQNHPES